ncbi:PREDICTED: uncharacterized protein C6orf106 homolog [Priapulus caudatus]|uniref:Uncharacterized protein C6orf106 homolog n=1 Tax=Priapulus caudatus TaxID=37621 RepID=A0ABM1EHI3_PRICU|nr:PREDICTED: uncharacterized protein C6orf106 homolog [Priapulus caudatus]
MDVDGDVDQQLLQQFSSLGTTDKDVLIAEFQKLLGHQLNPAGCAFFLDMNNWNLQAAICAYYDFEMPKLKLPGMAFISDVTIGEGEAVPPNTGFLKTWRIKNTGSESWPPGCCLRYTQGEQLGSRDRTMVGPLAPQQCADVSVEMVSPAQPGIYQGQWRMSSPTGMFFGEVIWVIVSVEEDGMLGVTQQLSSLSPGGEQHTLHTEEHRHPDRNPFETPQQQDRSHIQSMNGFSPTQASSFDSPQSHTQEWTLSPSPVRTSHEQQLHIPTSGHLGAGFESRGEQSMNDDDVT